MTIERVDPTDTPIFDYSRTSYYMNGFVNDLDKFREMYRIPLVEPTLHAAKVRLEQFEKIIKDEVNEIDDIDELFHGDELNGKLLAIKTSLADLLGDIIVYCASEAQRWDIPVAETLMIIMDSNFSKLGEDGKAIVQDGKVMKGPNYWKPEPKIAQLLLNHTFERELQTAMEHKYD